MLDAAGACARKREHPRDAYAPRREHHVSDGLAPRTTHAPMGVRGFGLNDDRRGRRRRQRSVLSLLRVHREREPTGTVVPAGTSTLCETDAVPTALAVIDTVPGSRPRSAARGPRMNQVRPDSYRPPVAARSRGSLALAPRDHDHAQLSLCRGLRLAIARVGARVLARFLNAGLGLGDRLRNPLQLPRDRAMYSREFGDERS